MTLTALARPAPRRRRGVAIGAVVGGALALAALSLLAPYALAFDPLAWLVWGRETTRLALDTASGPSWKPFPVLFTTPFALAGDAAPALWLIVARAGGLLALAGAYALAARLGGRWAGVAAAAVMALSPWWVFNTALGNSEGLLAAAVVWAVLAHLAGHRRAALALITAAALMRPEAWPFLAAYGIWLWRDDRRAVLVAAALVPLLWFGPDVIGAGGALDASHTGARRPAARRARSTPRSRRSRCSGHRRRCSPCPPLIAAVIAVVAGGPLARRIALAAAAWIAIVAAMTSPATPATRAIWSPPPRSARRWPAPERSAPRASPTSAPRRAARRRRSWPCPPRPSRPARPGLRARRARERPRVRRRDRRRRRARRAAALLAHPHQQPRALARRLAARSADARPRRDARAPRGADPRPVVLRRRPRTAARPRLPTLATTPGWQIVAACGRAPQIEPEDDELAPYLGGRWRSSSMAGPGTGRRRLGRPREGRASGGRGRDAVLADGGDALDAAQAAVIVLEDDPAVQRGPRLGARRARVRVLDASVMRGSDRAAGAVAALRGIRNPVLAARAVLDEGRHVMLAGEPAGTSRARPGWTPRPRRGFAPRERQRAFEPRRDRRRGRPRRPRRHRGGDLDRRDQRQAPRAASATRRSSAPGRGPTTRPPRSPAPATARRSSASRSRTRSTR